jgi:hypothetical protein
MSEKTTPATRRAGPSLGSSNRQVKFTAFASACMRFAKEDERAKSGRNGAAAATWKVLGTSASVKMNTRNRECRMVAGREERERAVACTPHATWRMLGGCNQSAPHLTAAPATFEQVHPTLGPAITRVRLLIMMRAGVQEPRRCGRRERGF